jgi:GntR family transcriptional repressor for pyruvate dehydrogenase complex
VEIGQTVAAGTLKRAAPPKPVYVQVVEQIQELIKNGHLSPGDQLLPERELAETLGVSRTSVRKALATMDGMGIIAVTPRDGAYVRRRCLEDAAEPLTQMLFQEREHVRHLFEVRQIIETQAARLAALRRDEADLACLHNLNRRFEADMLARNLTSPSNTEFHLCIVRAAKNPVLTQIMSTVLEATIEVYAAARTRTLSRAPNLLQFVTEHEQIVQAIARRDPNEAAAALARHIDDARRRIEGEETETYALTA